MRIPSAPARALSLALILMPALLTFGCAAPSSPVPTRTHVDEEAGFQIDYPVDWERSQEPDDGSTTADPVATVAFSAPLTGDPSTTPPRAGSPSAADSPSAPGTASITVIAERLAETDDAGLDEYSERGMEQLAQVVKDMRIIDEGRTELAGLPARRLTYTGELGDKKPTWRQLWTLVNGRVYILTYVGMGPAFDRHKKTFDSMAESFKVFKPAAAK